MNDYYTTGKFAELANISVRTIRYYDQIGLLKPALIMANGYRKYKDSDFKKLQRILALKQLGFSLEEIMSMIINNDDNAMGESLLLQSQLLEKEINHLNTLKDAVDSAIEWAKVNSLKWEHIIQLINLMNNYENVAEHYKNANNLEVRIHLHELYSVNHTNWYAWLMHFIKLKKNDKVLEIGAGNGSLWLERKDHLKSIEVFISDISQGMVNKAKEILQDVYSFMIFDAHSIPFKKEYFDIVIANHMLFYLRNLDLGLSEVQRVLKSNGTFYCSTYGKNHMKEITSIAREFDLNISLSENSLTDNFGLENGKGILKKYFSNVEMHLYKDSLEITEVKPLFDYIMSCHGNQKEILAGRMELFFKFLENRIKKSGKVHVTKQVGVFICTNA